MNIDHRPIRAAALDAAIVETLKRWPGMPLDAIQLFLTGADQRKHFQSRREFAREVRNRLQRLQAAGLIKQARRGVWEAA